MTIRSATEADTDAIVALSLTAWDGVFDAMLRETPDFVTRAFYPEGWRARQAADVRALVSDTDTDTLVDVSGHELRGFVSIRLHPEDKMGEIAILATRPDARRSGVATALTDAACQRIAAAGMEMVMVETGGDSGHAPARAFYEAAGFERWPVARYFRPLDKG